MPIRITGMNSGLDTDRIIQELVRGQKAKVDAIKKNQISIQGKQHAWKELNTKALKLFNGKLGQMRYTDAYLQKTSKVSNAAKATVVTGASAVNGVQELQINNLAKTGILTGAKLANGVTANTKISDLSGMSINSGEEMSFTVTVGGKETQINLTGDTKIQDVVDQLKNAGLNANFDATNGRFFISSKTMGAAGDFSLVADNINGFNALNAMGINVYDRADYEDLAGVSVGSPEYLAMVSAEIARLKATDEAERTATEKLLNDLDVKMQNKLNAYKAYLVEMEYITGTEADNLDMRNATDVATLMGKVGDAIAALDSQLGLLDPSSDAEEIERINNEIAWLSEYDNDDYLADNDQLGAYQTKIGYLTTDIDGAPASYTAAAEDKVNADIAFAANALTLTGNQIGENGASRIKGQDAEIFLNGATFTSNTNTFNINGLTITAVQVTDPGEVLTITTEDDTDGIYNMIKDFIKEYNALINEMDRLYNAESAKDYKPLTEEEKEAMSESEIEKWEEKVKDSLLRRDSSLYNISSAMKTAMSSAVSVNGKNMYLADFGIEALSYFLAADNEKNAFHIFGDEDSLLTDERGMVKGLKEWIANDPKTVTDFFVGLSRNLHAAMDKILLDRNADFKSAMTIYNDKQLKKEYDNYTSAIAKQEAKLLALEDKYYKQFSAMEVAMAKMQSSQSALAGLLGM